MRFNFTGKAVFNGMDKKVPWYRDGVTKNGAQYKSVNFAVVVQNNRGFVEAYGARPSDDVIRTIGTNKQKLDIKWEDRFDNDVIESVANFRKHTTSIDGERSTFITDYDFLETLADNKEKLDGARVTVTGDVTKNVYNGKVSNRFQVRNVYFANENTGDALRITAEIFYRADDIDLTDWKDEKKIYFNAYTLEFIDKKNVYVQQQFVLDASKIDFEKPRNVEVLNYNLKQLGLAYEDGKIKINLNKKKVYHMEVICSYVNGAEEIPFSEDTLTENQREAIKLGIKTIDDFRPAGTIYGNRVQMLKIFSYNLNRFEEGVEESDITLDEFEENIYVVPKTEVVSTSNDDGDDDSESLFG